MDFDIGVVAVGLARQQRLELAAFALDLQRAKRGEAFGLGRGVVFHLAEFDERDGVFEIAVDLLDAAEPVFEHGALAHQLLRGFRVVPEARVFGFGVEFG